MLAAKKRSRKKNRVNKTKEPADKFILAALMPDGSYSTNFRMEITPLDIIFVEDDEDEERGDPDEIIYVEIPEEMQHKRKDRKEQTPRRRKLRA